MTAKEYLKQAYLLDKQIQVEVKELEQNWIRAPEGPDFFFCVKKSCMKKGNIMPLLLRGNVVRESLKRLSGIVSHLLRTEQNASCSPK